jgi:hypothetical protein
MVFLGPRANSERVHKFQVALHGSYAPLLMLTSEFRPNATLEDLSQQEPPLAGFPLPTSHHFTFFTSQRFTLLSKQPLPEGYAGSQGPYRLGHLCPLCSSFCLFVLQDSKR